MIILIPPLMKEYITPPPQHYSYKDILLRGTMSPTEKVDNVKSPPPPPPDISQLAEKMDGLFSQQTAQQTAQFEQLKTMIETSINMKDQKIQHLETELKNIKKLHSICESPTSETSLHSSLTSPQLIKIGASMHIPDISIYLPDEYKCKVDTWKYRTSHSYLAYYLLDRTVGSLVNMHQLPMRQVRNKTLFPVNLQFNSIFQRDVAMQLLQNKCYELHHFRPHILHSLHGFPELSSITKTITQMLSQMKQKHEIANFKIMDFFHVDQNTIAPLYSIQYRKTDKFTKPVESKPFILKVFKQSSSENFPNDAFLQHLQQALSDHQHQLSKYHHNLTNTDGDSHYNNHRPKHADKRKRSSPTQHPTNSKKTFNILQPQTSASPTTNINGNPSLDFSAIPPQPLPTFSPPTSVHPVQTSIQQAPGFLPSTTSNIVKSSASDHHIEHNSPPPTLHMLQPRVIQPGQPNLISNPPNMYPPQLSTIHHHQIGAEFYGGNLGPIHHQQHPSTTMSHIQQQQYTLPTQIINNNNNPFCIDQVT